MSFGLDEFLRSQFSALPERQRRGRVVRGSRAEPRPEDLLRHGQTMALIANHVLMTRNAELGQAIFPAIKKAVECIRNDRDPAARPDARVDPFDNEMIKGQYTSHNYLVADRPALRHPAGPLPRRERTAAADWLKFHDSL